MKFLETKLKDAVIIEAERFSDDRGVFARAWSQKEFLEHGLNPNIVECNLSFNTRKGALRGMHFQQAPHQQAKLIRCTMGAIYDVIVELRSSSPTFKDWFARLRCTERREACNAICSRGFRAWISNFERLFGRLLSNVGLLCA